MTPRHRTGGGVSVLVAEDSRTQAEQLKDLLETRGYAVVLASDGEQALEAARRGKPTLVITDIVMPGMDGYALCRALKSDPALKDVPVIMLTALSSMQEIAKSLECGADNFIRKPYEPMNLLSRIDYILSNRALRSERRTRMGLEIHFGGKTHLITSEREQILDLLVSSYEEAVQANEGLKLKEREVSGLNEVLRLRAAELETANRELESFAYSVSHDLRSPLRAIDGFSKILQDSCGERLDDEERRLLATIRGNANKMAQLIEDLLRLSQVGRAPLAPQEIDMAALARAALNELQPAPNAKCVIEPLPAAWGDAALIRQVWVNLLSNALKYSSGRDKPVVEVSGHAESAANVYRVKDNGAGFDMRYYDKLFGVFQRLHSSDEFPGTGIGLSIVQRVVARHGGRVWAEGKVGGGAAFSFSLPNADERR
jgi:two-component system sensor histidine kinase/response regulator